MFEKNLAELGAARLTSYGDIPLIVLSEGSWDPLPGYSDAENQQAWQAWQTMQSELIALSPNGRQVIARRSGHSVQLEQPDLVIDAIRETVQERRSWQRIM